VNDAEKIKYERNDDDGAKYAQATARAPSRMTVIASTDAEEQQQNYDYQQHDSHPEARPYKESKQILCAVLHSPVRVVTVRQHNLSYIMPGSDRPV
jgi:hypothetical protein